MRGAERRPEGPLSKETSQQAGRAVGRRRGFERATTQARRAVLHPAPR